MSTVTVAPFFQAARIGSVGLGVLAICLSSFTLWRDRRAFSSTERIRKFIVYTKGGTQRVFRVAALVGSILMALAYIDYYGVFGIYPVGVRLLFKSSLILNISGAMLAYVYYAAKPCFPFVFTDFSKATKRLKYSIIAFCIVGNICYAMTLAATSALILLGFGAALILAILATVVAAILLYFRLYSIVKKATHQSGSGNVEKLVSTMKKWRSFTIAYCMCHFITLTPVSLNVLGALGDPESVLPTVEANNFVDPTMITAAALTETGLILAALIPTYLFIWRSWLSATAAKHTTLSGDSSSGSVESFTDTYTESGKSVNKRGSQRSSRNPSGIYISSGFSQPNASSAASTPRASNDGRNSGFSSPRRTIGSGFGSASPRSTSPAPGGGGFVNPPPASGFVNPGVQQTAMPAGGFVNPGVQMTTPAAGFVNPGIQQTSTAATGFVNPGIQQTSTAGFVNPGMQQTSTAGFVNPGIQQTSTAGFVNPGIQQTSTAGFVNPGMQQTSTPAAGFVNPGVQQTAAPIAEQSTTLFVNPSPPPGFSPPPTTSSPKSAYPLPRRPTPPSSFSGFVTPSKEFTPTSTDGSKSSGSDSSPPPLKAADSTSSTSIPPPSMPTGPRPPAKSSTPPRPSPPPAPRPASPPAGRPASPPVGRPRPRSSMPPRPSSPTGPRAAAIKRPSSPGFSNALSLWENRAHDDGVPAVLQPRRNTNPHPAVRPPPARPTTGPRRGTAPFASRSTDRIVGL